jgi:hypothetical protein
VATQQVSAPRPVPARGPVSGPERSAPHGSVVTCLGVVTAVLLSAHDAPARFAVDLATEAPRPGRVTPTGERIRLVWIGQRRIPGIEAGRWLRIEGFRSDHDDIPTIFNPRYDLLAGAPHG